MAARYLRLHQDRIVLGGIPFTISVRKTTTAFHALWFCGACSHRSDTALSRPTIDAAVDAAREDMAGHDCKAVKRRA